MVTRITLYHTLHVLRVLFVSDLLARIDFIAVATVESQGTLCLAVTIQNALLPIMYCSNNTPGKVFGPNVANRWSKKGCAQPARQNWVLAMMSDRAHVL